MSSSRTAAHAAAARARATAQPRSAVGRGTARRTGSGRGSSGRRRSARRRRRRGAGLARWWPALLVGAAVLAAVVWGVDGRPAPVPGAGTCTVPGGSITVTAEQAGNAAVIAQVGRDRGLPDRAVVIALATAQQESRLRNLDHGDRDSLGLFQQRPSQGWGTPDQVQDPVYSAGEFYDHLVRVPGWETGRLTEVAQAVQRSGYPELYQQWEGMAQELSAALAADALACS